MHRPLIAAGMFAAALTLTACGQSAEAAFLEEYRDRAPELSDFSDEQLLGTAESVCRQLEDGASVEDVRNQQTENYMGGELDAAAINRIVAGTEAAASKFCPEAVDQ